MKMPRPFKTRRIDGEFASEYFKPRGRQMAALKEVHLEADEVEALRLADLEGEYQNDAAERMGVSRQTFGNILKSARRKVADALITGKAIRMSPVVSGGMWCRRCGRSWSEAEIQPGRQECPECYGETGTPIRGRGRRRGQKR
ncbi:MAG: DUF134 domain-containing protein [Candidatus Marinimicrobia bacterium]|nr:DUF134 domain-containing protein [Candidatus Neomarinimicrobiota bacterium]